MTRKLTSIGVILMGAWLGLFPASADQQTKATDPQGDAKVLAAVEQYVRNDTKLKGGFFLSDPQEKQVRDLTFDFVHKSVDARPGNLQVVCVDFLDRAKNRLDIDFFLKPTPKGNLEVTDIKIHKVNGVERK